MKDSNDRGLYKQAGSPFWYICYADRSGRIIRTSTNTKSKTLAREILNKKKTQVVENRHLDVKKVPKVTFHELCEKYWNMCGKNLRTKGLLKTNEDGTQTGMIEIWKTGLGNIMLSELTQHSIEKFLSSREEEKELSAATYNRHLSMLKAMLNKGREWGLLLENPAAPIKKRKEDGGRTRFLSTEEVQRLLDGASKTFKPLLITALHTGMRRGELLSLLWKDVDLHSRIIIVQQSKSGKKRMIPLDDTVHEVLKKLPSRFGKGVVFPSTRNGKDPLTNTNKTFTRLTDKVELKDVRFHDLRHTFASHLVMSGVDLVTVQQLLGHAHINMTMRYAHLAPEHRAKAVKALDAALSPANAPVSKATDINTDIVKNQAL